MSGAVISVQSTVNGSICKPTGNLLVRIYADSPTCFVRDVLCGDLTRIWETVYGLRITDYEYPRHGQETGHGV